MRRDPQEFRSSLPASSSSSSATNAARSPEPSQGPHERSARTCAHPLERTLPVRTATLKQDTNCETEVSLLAEVLLNAGESLESALKRFKRKVMTEDIIKDIKRHAFYLKPGQKIRVKAALARKRSRKNRSRDSDSDASRR
jgi:small subunit ribosomal protein S21